MNLKTTIALLVLAAAGVVVAFFGFSLPPAWNLVPPPPTPVADAGTRAELDAWDAGKLERIEVRAGDRVTVLERDDKGEWSLPGKWPTRGAEVTSLVELLASLRSRFEPLPIDGDIRLTGLGLDRPAVSVQLKVAGTDHRLDFGEPRGGADRFERPTYVCLDGKPEALQLAPGLVALLDRPTDYYQQRRLFPGERVAKEGSAQEKVERLATRKGATVVVAKDDKEGGFPHTLTFDGTEWQLSQPALDRLDSKALEALLSAVPELWAEQLLTIDRNAVAAALGAPDDPFGALTALAWVNATTPDRSPRWLQFRSGLDKPERTLSVSLPGGSSVTLQIGAVSGQSKQFKPPPFPPRPGMPPLPPTEETIEMRYARVQGNPQVFEIKGDRLKDVFVPLDNLRDAQVARFKTADVQKVALTHGKTTIVLARNKDRWKLLEPIQADADRDKVEELLNKASSVEARGKDVDYKSDPKKTGLDQPATSLTLTVEEEDKDKAGKKKTRTVSLLLGKQEGGKVFVKNSDYPRVNAVDENLATLAGRDPLAYRGKRLFDFAANELDQITLSKGDQKVAMKHEGGVWKLTAPVAADADNGRVSQMVTTLGSLEVLEYVNDAPTKEQLASQYGLDKPELTATLAFVDTSKPARTLLVGRARGPNQGFFAKLADGSSVFVINNDLHNTLSRDALAWRSRRILDFQPADLAGLSIERGGQTIALQQTAGLWRMTSPTTADADTGKVSQMAANLGKLEAVEWVTNNAGDQLDVQYGLAKPALTITTTFTDKTKPARTLQLGKARGAKPGLFARLFDSPAVFAVNADIRDSLDQDALALLPKQLWQVAQPDIAAVKIERQGQEPYQLKRKESAWQITGPFEAAATADTVNGLLIALAAPQCDSYKALDAKDLAPFGLDKPMAHVTVIDRDGKEHALLIGGKTAPDSSSRYAKTAKSPAIFVVNDSLAGTLNKGALDLLDPVLLRIEPGQLERIQAKGGDATLTLERKGSDWQVQDTPAGAFVADALAVSQAESLLQNLTAERYAAYGPKAELAKFGLDKPETAIALKVRKPGAKAELSEHVLELGKQAEMDGGRYARLDKGPGVAVLSARTAKELTRGYLDYVNRNVLKFDAGAVKLLQRDKGPDKLELARRADAWQLTKPADERADDRAVQALLQKLASLRAQSVAAFPAKDLKTYGLDAPLATVHIALNEDQKPASHVLKIGKEVNAAGDHYATIDAGTAVVVLPGTVLRPLLAGALAFRDRSLTKFASADVVHLERDRRKAAFAQVDGTWKMTGPLQTEADHDALEELVNTLGRLRADELVVEKPAPADLKSYGLDRPEARWRLQAGDKDVLDLQIGKRELGGPRHYARLAGRDVVFLLDAKLSQRLLGEYRARTVWGPSIDAAQVDVLRVGGKNPFALERFEGSWQVAGKPDVKVNTEAVNETLGALAGLKAVRYAIDKDADLQLFGLKPPEATLEVTTRSGKRLLSIGGREGDSQRRYASVGDMGRTDVLVISEADAAKLLRDLAAYTKKGL